MTNEGRGNIGLLCGHAGLGWSERLGQGCPLGTLTNIQLCKGVLLASRAAEMLGVVLGENCYVPESTRTRAGDGRRIAVPFSGGRVLQRGVNLPGMQSPPP